MSAKGWIRRFAGDRDGAAALEIAFVLPLFLTMVLGLFGFGWVMNCASNVRYALEQSARQLPLDPTIDQARLQSMVQARLQGLGTNNVTVTLTWDPPSGGVKVAHATASYPFAVDVPFLPRAAGTYVARTDVPVAS